jgi:hypothetical protein
MFSLEKHVLRNQRQSKVELEHVGGTYGGIRKPTKYVKQAFGGGPGGGERKIFRKQYFSASRNERNRFMCLLLKMLQIQPEQEIVVEFIKNEEYKYVRCLGALYLRCTGRPADVYEAAASPFRVVVVVSGKFFLGKLIPGKVPGNIPGNIPGKTFH